LSDNRMQNVRSVGTVSRAFMAEEDLARQEDQIFIAGVA
jgi:hypothetical protein